MATVSQITADVANAQLSTGPRTEAGKQTVADNAIRHGMFTCPAHLDPTGQKLVEIANDTFRRSYPQPEAELWLRDRARALAAPLFNSDDEDSLLQLNRFLRWERQFTRDIDRMLKLLNALPKPEPAENDKAKPIQPAQSPNSPCSGGSGLKFKRCCGSQNRSKQGNPRVTPS
jgi:hypothetical protein